jgi:hypothetical protein
MINTHSTCLNLYLSTNLTAALANIDIYNSSHFLQLLLLNNCRQIEPHWSAVGYHVPPGLFEAMEPMPVL